MVTFSLPLNINTDFAGGLFNLEDILKNEPQSLMLRMAGSAPIPPAMALAYWGLINHYKGKTQVIGNAFTSLETGGFLVWLGCHYQVIEPHAHIRVSSIEDYINEEGDLIARSDCYLDEIKSVHRMISKYVDVRHVVGKKLYVPQLQELGLLPSAIDDFLEGISLNTQLIGKEVLDANQ